MHLPERLAVSGMRRILLAHAKDYPWLDQLVDVVQAELEAQAPNTVFELVTAKQEFTMSEVSWANWPRHVVDSENFITGEPRFSSILVPGDGQIGKGTATLVEYALARGKSVVIRPWAGGYLSVTGVQCLDAKNYKGGWMLLTQED